MRLGSLSYADNVLLNYNKSQSNFASTVKELSSGLRINSAADDPSGLAIAEHLRTVSNGLQEGQIQVQNANNALTVADGALQTITEILQRMRTLVVEANSDLESAQQQANVQTELDQLTLEINRIASNANFNGMKLFDGSLSSTPPQVGQLLFVQNPALSGGGTLVSADPGGTTQPNRESVDTSVYVQSYDATTNELTVVITSQSNDPAFGPTQTSTLQIVAGTNMVDLGGGLIIGPINPWVVVDQNGTGNPVYQFDLGIMNANDVGKTAVMTSTPTQSYSKGEGLQVNVGVAEGDVVTMQIGAVSALNIGANQIEVGNLLTNQGSEARLDFAIDTITGMRAELGAQTVALDYSGNDAATQYVAQVASESAIRDANIGQATTEFTKDQIMVSVGTSVLSQMEISTQTLTSILLGALGGGGGGGTGAHA